MGQLINRRKQYPAALHDVLARTMILRHTADYAPDQVIELQAYRALKRVREFLQATRNGAENR